MTNSILRCHIDEVPTSFENLDEARALLYEIVPLTEVRIVTVQDQDDPLLLVMAPQKNSTYEVHAYQLDSCLSNDKSRKYCPGLRSHSLGETPTASHCSSKIIPSKQLALDLIFTPLKSLTS